MTEEGERYGARREEHGAQDLEKEPGFLQTGALGCEWAARPRARPTSLAGSPPCWRLGVQRPGQCLAQELRAERLVSEKPSRLSGLRDFLVPRKCHFREACLCPSVPGGKERTGL